MLTGALALALGLLGALSVRTIAVLGRAAPWTSAGWYATLIYCAAALIEVLAHRHLPAHAPYVALAVLTVAFAVAGVRDEPQGTPWWWPRGLGPTRAERRRP